VGLGQIESVLKGAEKTWLAELKGRDLEALPLAIRADLPDWVIERLSTRMSEAELLALARGLQQAAPLDLRVNTLKAPRQAVLDRLAYDEIEARPTRMSPVGVRLTEKPALNKHPMFLDGAVEVQDEGSQILGMLMEPRRGEMVVDFCAGAGGKTLQMGAAMNSTGRLYAFDVSDKRLANLAPRLKRSGLSNVFPQRIANENDAKVKRLRGKIDRVLVDAPCTGLGTLRRNPDLKSRQTPEGLVELNAKQKAILAAAASLVKPGGRLVYGTCSLLTEENEDIVAEFLAANPGFTLVPAAEVLKRQGITVAGTDQFLRLYPHVHDTDGFFAAVMERNK
jgi:16S rRNA (cytosine967-C5)-methyltransferase